jgi:hypothetical protein
MKTYTCKCGLTHDLVKVYPVVIFDVRRCNHLNNQGCTEQVPDEVNKIIEHRSEFKSRRYYRIRNIKY